MVRLLPLGMYPSGVQMRNTGILPARDLTMNRLLATALATVMITGVAQQPFAAAPAESPYFLTPKPSPAPRINGPKVYGCRPGNPFLYRVPTTGARPIAFAAGGLPAGLQLDANSGIIMGTAPPRGAYVVTLARQRMHSASTRGV